jgi:WD40 repeat protein
MKRISLILSFTLWFSSNVAFSQTSAQKKSANIELQATISSDLMKHTPASYPRDYDHDAFAFSNNGDYLFVLSDTQFAILDSKTAEVIKSFPTVKPKNVYCRGFLVNKNNNLQVAIQVDNKNIVIISDVEKASTSILDVKDKKIYAERSIIPTKDEFTSMDFSKDGKEFYAKNVEQNKISVYRTSTGELSRVIPSQSGDIYILSGCDNEVLYKSGLDCEIRNLQTNELIRKYTWKQPKSFGIYDRHTGIEDAKGKSFLNKIIQKMEIEYIQGYTIPNTDSYLFDIPISGKQLAVVFNSNGESVPLPQKDDQVFMDDDYQFNFSPDGRYMVIKNNGAWEIWAIK